MQVLSNQRIKGFSQLFRNLDSAAIAVFVGLMACATAAEATPRNLQRPRPAPQNITFSSTDVGQTSAPQTQTFTFSSSVTLGSVQVVTQGAPSLDFQRPASDTGSTSCKAGASYTSGQFCSVQVTFTPMDPGLRMGAVVLEDNSSPMLVLATAYVSGIGQGAGFAFTPPVVSDIAGAVGFDPEFIAVDAEGNLYASSPVSATILKVTPAGTVSTVAGGGIGCAAETDSLGDGCAATSATLAYPEHIAVDGVGNIYVGSDSGTDYVNTIRKVGFDGRITLFAGGGNGCPSETDEYGDGCPAIDARLSPGNIAVDSSGVVYFDDSASRELRRVAADGTITQVNTPYPLGSGLALDASGNLYFPTNRRGIKTRRSTSCLLYPVRQLRLPQLLSSTPSRLMQRG